MVMVRFTISDSDHDRISRAVNDAEAHSDGEIITMIAPRSDAYHDVGLHYAVAAMLILLTFVAAFPQVFVRLATHLAGGWGYPLPTHVMLTMLLGAQILVFLIVRYALAWIPLRLAITPSATKSRRVRRQAVTIFRAVGEGRTKGRTAVLLYLSLAEHRAEIVADEGINRAITPERWGEAMAALVDPVREGRPTDGLVAAIGMIGEILAEYVPATRDNPNELPDRLIEL
jgi:putative membrane protein